MQILFMHSLQELHQGTEHVKPKRANAPPPGYRRIRFERGIYNHNDLSRSRFSVVA